MLKTHFWWSWGWFVVLGLPHYFGIPNSKLLPVVGLKLQTRFATPCCFGGSGRRQISWFPDGGHNRDEENCTHHRYHGAGWVLLSRVPFGQGLLGKNQGPWTLEPETGRWCDAYKGKWIEPTWSDPESNPNSDCRHFGVRSNLLVGMIKTLLAHFWKSPLLTGYWDMLYIYISLVWSFKWSPFWFPFWSPHFG